MYFLFIRGHITEERRRSITPGLTPSAALLSLKHRVRSFLVSCLKVNFNSHEDLFLEQFQNDVIHNEGGGLTAVDSRSISCLLNCVRVRVCVWRTRVLACERSDQVLQ